MRSAEPGEVLLACAGRPGHRGAWETEAWSRVGEGMTLSTQGLGEGFLEKVTKDLTFSDEEGGGKGLPKRKSSPGRERQGKSAV